MGVQRLYNNFLLLDKMLVLILYFIPGRELTRLYNNLKRWLKYVYRMISSYMGVNWHVCTTWKNWPMYVYKLIFSSLGVNWHVCTT